MCIDCCSEAKIIVSGSTDKTVRIWDREKLLHKLIGHQNEVYGVALTNDQDIKAKKIASCSGDRTIKIWSIE